jgi:arsenical pump membrane protein
VNRNVIESRYLNILDIPYYLSPFLSSVVLLAIDIISFNDIYKGLIGYNPESMLIFSSGPFSTLILFLSIAFISLTLEVSGFFKYISVKMLKLVDHSGYSLFAAVFWISGVLALFTSNDIVILTFTPFLLVFLDFLDIDSLPFLFANFFAANVFSMITLIGNETNIIASNIHNIGFIEHLMYLGLPGFLGGLTCFSALFWVFKEKIDEDFSREELPKVSLDRWELLSFSLIIGTLLSLGFLSIKGYLLWHIGLIWVTLTALLFVLPNLIEIYRSNDDLSESYLWKIFEDMPLEVIPFLLGFFVLVEALSVTGISVTVAEQINILFEGKLHSIYGIGIMSTLTTALVNNIPATTMISEILTNFETIGESKLPVFSLIIASNIGANLTPIGALAGIMWMKMLRNKGYDISFKQFTIYGLKVTPITAFTSFATLYLVSLII